jgi:hypothetical protein
VGRIWKSHGLKPHRVSTFKLSNDKAFAEKLEAIVGLYVSPPENAIVFSCDEKSQIQALDKTQPGLPLKKGKAATMTHDYKRNGTTTLFCCTSVVVQARLLVFRYMLASRSRPISVTNWNAYVVILPARLYPKNGGH